MCVVLSHFISSSVAMQQWVTNTEIKYDFCCNGRFMKCAEPNIYGGEGANHASAVRVFNFAEITEEVH